MSEVAVLIANTGASDHVGDGRFSVHYARQLARLGIASFRIDASGLGDSVAAGLRRDGRGISFEQLVPGVVAGAEWLAGNGYPNVVAFGICSGAYLSQQAARYSAHIAGLLLINLPRFFYPDGVTLQDAGRHDAGSTRAHFRAMLNMKKWRDVLRGETSLLPVMRTLARYGLTRAHGWFDALVIGLGGAGANRRPALRVMHELDARGVETRMLFSRLDPGLDQIDLNFGAHGKRLRRFKHTRMRVAPIVDHELLSARARLYVFQYSKRFLFRYFAPVCAAASEATPLKSGDAAGLKQGAPFSDELRVRIPDAGRV